MKQRVKAVIVGNCAFDVNTFLNRDGEKEKVVVNKGGACIYSLIPASIFNKIGVVTRIGNDFDEELINRLNIDTLGLKKVDGKSDEEALSTACKVATESIKDYGVEHLLDKTNLFL